MVFTMKRPSIDNSGDEEGWMGSKIKYIEPWESDTFKQFCKFAKIENESLTKMQRRYTKHLCENMDLRTPGTASSIELMKKSKSKAFSALLKEFSPRWTEPRFPPQDTHTDFETDMFTSAISASRWMISFLRYWTIWCDKNKRERDKESFDEFSSGFYHDSDLSSRVVKGMDLIVQATTPLPTLNSFPVEENSWSCLDSLPSDDDNFSLFSYPLNFNNK